MATITPMMAQYQEIKAANPGLLLFYRMGDFYELFFEDAEIASQALGITLTKRGSHQGQDIPMCGVPHHAAQEYLNKLIRLGHRVAVCEQTETPQEAKKRGSKAVVRRKVTRHVTAGTLTEDNLLEPKASNHLCAIASIRHREDETLWAIAWVDLSTGSIASLPCGRTEIIGELARLAPSEVLVSDGLIPQDNLSQAIAQLGATRTVLAAHVFSSSEAARTIQDYYEVDTLDGFGHFSAVQLCALAAILHYLQKTQIDHKASLEPPKNYEINQSVLIDPATRTNLELTTTLSGERKGSLLDVIDHTVTAAGGRLIEQHLASPLRDMQAIRDRHDSVAQFLNAVTLREDLRKTLARLPDMVRCLSRLALGRGGPRDLVSIGNGLALGLEIKAILDQWEDPLVPVNQRICDEISSTPRHLIDHLQAALIQEPTLSIREGGFVRPGYHPQLDELRTLGEDSRKIIAGLQQDYSNRCDVKNLKIRHNNILGYFIEVNAAHAEKLQDEKHNQTFIHRQTMANAMRFTTTELSELEAKIANAQNDALDIELDIFEQLRKQVVDESGIIRSIAHALAALDIGLSHATLAERHRYCRPALTNGVEFEIHAGRHPVIEQVLKQESSKRFVSNDCDLGPAEEAEDSLGAIWILTGPNMGGKSTFLRQNALIAILAQIGCFVPAQSAKIGLVDRIFSRVGASDDLARGRSTFMVEMVETAAILNQATRHSLVILDEIGRGTATFDGLSIAWASMEHLHEVNQCRALFATHYHELVPVCEKHARLFPVTMKVKEWEGDVIFLHEVVAGAADRSYGIQVAKLAGLPASVVERAKLILAQLEDVDRANSAKALVEDLPLFAKNLPTKTNETSLASAFFAEIAETIPDELTPRQALEKLYEWRKKAQQLND